MKAKNVRIGRKTEQHFFNLMKSRGNSVSKSSKKQDIFDHIDFFVNGFGVDVKGNKSSDFIVLELLNVNGDDGWLKGKADYIVFDIMDMESFMFFLTEELLIFVENDVDKSRLYTRKGKKDSCVIVSYHEIKHLKHKIINY